MSRLFVAVRPPGAVVDQLLTLPRPNVPGVRWVPPERWHVTLRFLGDADPGLAAQRLAAAALPAATATVGTRALPLGEHVLAVDVRGLEHLAAAVTIATADIGRAPDRRPFHGHLTVARVRPGLGGTSAAAAVTPGVRCSFEVTAVALIESTSAPDGVRYRTLASVPTGAGG